MREQCMTLYDKNGWQGIACRYNIWHCIAMYDNVWHCMPMREQCMTMYDKNGWQGIACRASESQVPSLIDQTVTPGYSRSLFYFCAFFGWKYLPNIIWWHWGIPTVVLYFCYFFRIYFVDNIWWHRGIPALYSTSALVCWQYLPKLFGDTGVFPSLNSTSVF